MNAANFNGGPGATIDDPVDERCADCGEHIEACSCRYSDPDWDDGDDDYDPAEEREEGW